MAKKKPYMMEWYGSDVLLKELEKAGGNVQTAIKEAIKESFVPIVNDLSGFTGSEHKLTGRTEDALAEDYGKWTTKGNLNVKVGYAIKDYKIQDPDAKGSKNVQGTGEAAIFLQVGTPKMQPYFFITHALHDNLGKVIDAQQKALERVVSDMLSKIPKEK